MRLLTPEQARVKAAIVHLCRDGIAPSYEEIGVEAGLASKSNVLRQMRALREKGHIYFEDGRARSVRPIGQIDTLRARSTTDLRAMRDTIDTILQERSQ